MRYGRREHPELVTPVPKRRYLVLGADGFIGSAIVRAALGRGADVIALCVRDPWRLADIDDTRLNRVAALGWHEAGFAKQFHALLDGADAFIHLGYQPPRAGLGPAAREDHERVVNTGATVALAAAAGDVPVVFASSADVYGTWHDVAVSEDTDPNPSTPYAVAKLEAERTLGDRSTVLRIATVYGPGELVPRAIPSFIKAGLSGGTAVLHAGGRDVKDYVPLEAVADAFLAAAQAPRNGPRVFNIGSGVGRSTAAVLDAVARVLGTVPAVDDVPSPRAPSHLVVWPQRARTELGFDPDADFDAGLRAEAAWLDANRERWE
jgi:UDP-glucose 4-epimerase